MSPVRTARIVLAAAAVTQYRCVTAVGAHAATNLYGVAAAAAVNVGDYVPVHVLGTAPIEAGAAIPVGTIYVIADAQGRAIVGGTAAACLARLCPGQFAAAAGDVVECHLYLTL